MIWGLYGPTYKSKTRKR